MDRRERQRGDDGDAVAVGDDPALPFAPALLRLEDAEVIRVHLGDDERHIGVHPVVLGVAEDEPAGAGEGGFDLGGDRRVQRREDKLGVDLLWIAGRDGHRGDTVRHRLGAQPPRGFGVRLTGRPLRRRDGDEVEPRMIRQQSNERLADGARRAEHRDGPPPQRGCLWLGSGHLSNARVIRSYEPTAARSSARSMNSSVVCAT